MITPVFLSDAHLPVFRFEDLLPNVLIFTVERYMHLQV